MFQRKSLILTAGIVLLVTALLLPVTNALQKSTEEADIARHEIEKMYMDYWRHQQEEAVCPVEALMELENAWAIEDSRSEADVPLVTQMYNGADELGFDRGENTFYCSIGMDDEVWPQLKLTARGSENVRVAWIDDYTYDSRTDALREGYRYELLAYTDTEYAYFGLVFTGLPVVNVHTAQVQEITREDIAARVSICGEGYEAINAPALVHRRGGRNDDEAEKVSLHVEFHQISEKGKDQKPELSVLGMEADSDWLLISHEGDPSCMRNKLAFDLWRGWNPDGNAFALLESRMVEVFCQDTYMGLYQLIQRIQPEKELLRMGGSLERDLTARMIGIRYDTGRPVSDISLPIDGCMELRYAPGWMKTDTAFAQMQDYVTMNLPEGAENRLDDEAFAQLVLSRMDVREIMSYYLFMNVCSLGYDNVKNNVYIWARSNGDGYTYTLSPWDMDTSLRPIFSDGSDSINMWMELPVRMLELNVGNCRAVFREVFEEKREQLLTDDAIYQWIEEEEERINASGAYRRESARWQGCAQELNLSEVSAHTISQMGLLERYIVSVWPEEEAN